jgi:RHS repeat-associated protein
MAVDPTTNRIQTNGAGYDANGNLTAYGTGGFAAVYAYDVENRLGSATVSGTTYGYGYDGTNRRVFTGTVSGTSYTNELIYFYGADGKKLGVWSLTASTIQNVSINQWFAGRLLKGEDRLQSAGKYFPYGEDRYSPNPANPANDQEKFGTYTRDSATGLDYAYQRYYNSQTGRFMSSDPYQSSSGLADPQSWNHYSYGSSDPVNGFDPAGTCSASVTAGGVTSSETFDCYI